MVIVTFRKPAEKLTSMFSVKFKQPAMAKDFIKADAKHWAKVNGLKNWKLVNESPDTYDYFTIVDANGRTKLIYQYFQI